MRQQHQPRKIVWKSPFVRCPHPLFAAPELTLHPLSSFWVLGGLMGYVLWFSKSFSLLSPPLPASFVVDFYVKRKLIWHRKKENYENSLNVKWKVSAGWLFLSLWHNWIPCACVCACRMCVSISYGSLGKLNWSIEEAWKSHKSMQKTQLCLSLSLSAFISLSLPLFSPPHLSACCCYCCSHTINTRNV